MNLLAQLSTQVIAQWAIWLIIVCGIVALAVIGFRVLGVSPPAWVIQAFWVVVAVVVLVVLVKFLATI